MAVCEKSGTGTDAELVSSLRSVLLSAIHSREEKSQFFEATSE